MESLAVKVRAIFSLVIMAHGQFLLQYCSYGLIWSRICRGEVEGAGRGSNESKKQMAHNQVILFIALKAD